MAGARRGLRVLDVAVIAVCLACALGGAVVTMGRGDADVARRRVAAFVDATDERGRVGSRESPLPWFPFGPAIECFAAHEWHEGVRRLFATAREIQRRDTADSVLWPVDRVVGDELLQQLPDAVLVDLDAHLAELDASLPIAIDVRPQIVASVKALVAGRYDWVPRDQLWAWTNAFDPEAAEWVRLDSMCDHLDLIEPPAVAWSQRQAQWGALDDKLTRFGTALPPRVWSWCVYLDGERRRAHAGLRLLRLALAFHRRLPLPTLADPFADGPLRATITGDRADFTSAGEYLVRTAVRAR